jgi:hypothetical protein
MPRRLNMPRLNVPPPLTPPPRAPAWPVDPKASLRHRTQQAPLVGPGQCHGPRPAGAPRHAGLRRAKRNGQPHLHADEDGPRKRKSGAGLSDMCKRFRLSVFATSRPDSGRLGLL